MIFSAICASYVNFITSGREVLGTELPQTLGWCDRVHSPLALSRQGRHFVNPLRINMFLILSKNLELFPKKAPFSVVFISKWIYCSPHLYRHRMYLSAWKYIGGGAVDENHNNPYRGWWSWGFEARGIKTQDQSGGSYQDKTDISIRTGLKPKKTAPLGQLTWEPLYIQNKYHFWLFWIWGNDGIISK